MKNDNSDPHELHNTPDCYRTHHCSRYESTSTAVEAVEAALHN